MAFVCRALEIPRSRLYYKRRIPKRSRIARRPELARAITALLHIYPATYGYRRIHALLKRGGIASNPKTVWAIMRRKGWLSSAREKATRPYRRHEGKVAMKIPNTRWASDITQLRAWSGQKIRLAAILDCADRMPLAWRAKPNITGEDLSEMVREAVFKRFGLEKEKARGIEFLSDNGTEYRSKPLQQTLHLFGLKPCYTPIRSPESNGLMESFFKTLKRDYVYQNVLETPEDIIRHLPDWIAHYSEVAPHSALSMQSPAEFHRKWVSKMKEMPV